MNFPFADDFDDGLLPLPVVHGYICQLLIQQEADGILSVDDRIFIADSASRVADAFAERPMKGDHV